jgi:hypothetical protein
MRVADIEIVFRQEEWRDEVERYDPAAFGRRRREVQ